MQPLWGLVRVAEPIYTAPHVLLLLGAWRVLRARAVVGADVVGMGASNVVIVCVVACAVVGVGVWRILVGWWRVVVGWWWSVVVGWGEVLRVGLVPRSCT